ncbi:hypothetical protein JCGZ_00993 [Jatropha curcas]|uniref:FRIGIDA-like protein n=1 Tax=Jatropha curcas TaxID=180498 RepID=A0A067KSS2_JATCU|nr:FRIGIDA-like protein 1 [Jatropha curcas]KDP39236.1 hypothetical protein JCGZ_00993 [Jatropha curcas]
MASSSKGTEIATLKTIEAALKLIDTKKESLKRAYDDLQAHSSLLSSFNLSWSELDSHFTSLQTTLTHRFHRLQSLHSSSSAQKNPPSSHDLVDAPLDSGISDQPPAVNNGDPSSSSNPLVHDSLTRTEMELSQNRPELVSFCEKMDGRGLRNYISDHAKEREAIRLELVGLMAVALDPGAMVLDALDGFYSSSSSSKGDKDLDLFRLRKSCLDLLEVVIEIKPNLSNEVKERAKRLALEWKEKVSLNGDSPLEALGFLNLLVAYGMENEFDVGELVNYFVVIARFKQATSLCRAIGLGDKIADLIQKLIENGKHLLAVRFAFEFGLTDKFEPVSLLKDYLKDCNELSKKICMDTKNSIKAQNEARSREVNALKSVLKVVDEYKLESEYPRPELEKRIETLEKQKAGKKMPVPSPDNKPQQQPKKQIQQLQSKKQQAKKQLLNGNKRPRTSVFTGPAVPINIAGSNSTVPPFQQSHFPPAGLLPAAGPYGLVGSTPHVASYAGPPAGPFGLPGAAMGLAGNPNPATGHPYPLDPYMSSGYYDRPAAYGGYGLPPQYHSAYYSQ